MDTTHIPATETATEKPVITPIPVKEVFLHMGAHLDEYFLYCLLCLYGEKAFPGFSKAAVRFIEADIYGTDEEFDSIGIVPIGCGCGRFDEHRGKNGQKERLPGECATTLGAKYLGIMDRPELKELVADVLYFDTHSGCRATQLAELIKVLHRYNLKNDEYAVLSWSVTAIKAMIRQERFHYGSLPAEKSLIDLFQVDIAEGYFDDDPRARSNMFSRVRDSMQRKDECPTQLAHLLEALYRTPVAADDIEKWLDVALTAMNSDQVDFWKQVDLLKSQRLTEVKVLLGSREHSLGLMVCFGDNLNLQKAARHAGAQIVIIRQSSGNVQIFIDASIEGLNLANAARMIRFLELSAEGHDSIDWAGLGCEGLYEGVDQWYYFKGGNMLFNGSNTHKSPASKIVTRALVDVLEHAFHPRYLVHWCNERGIRMNPRRMPDRMVEAAPQNVN